MATNNRSPLAYTGRKQGGANKMGDVEIDSTDFSISEQGKVSLLGTSAIETVPTDSGTATPASSAVTFAGGAGIDTSASGATVTIAVEETDIRYTTVTVTAAEIKALAATQKELVAAPGAGKALEFISAAFKLNYGSEVFTESDDDFVVKYTDDSGAAASNVLENTGFIDQSADTIAVLLAAAVAGTAATSIENQALVLDNDGDGEIGGNASNDSTLTIGIAYRVHTL